MGLHHSKALSISSRFMSQRVLNKREKANLDLPLTTLHFDFYTP